MNTQTFLRLPILSAMLFLTLPPLRLCKNPGEPRTQIQRSRKVLELSIKVEEDIKIQLAKPKDTKMTEMSKSCPLILKIASDIEN